MLIPVDIANCINPGLDAVAHSHVFREVRDTEESVLEFALPLKPDDYPLITWTQVKVSWANELLDHAYIRIVCLSDAGIVPMSPPTTIRRHTWTALEWLIPAIPFQNGRLAVQVQLDPQYANDYVQLRILGFEQLLDGNAQYLFVNEEGKPKWCLRKGLLEEVADGQGLEDSFVTLRPIATTV